MKKTISLIALIACMGSFVIAGNPMISKTSGDKEESFAEKIKQSTLVVVLLEENQDYEAKLTKKGKTEMLATYTNSIKTYNDNIKEMVPQFIKMGSTVIYKTPTEIAGMSFDERSAYSYLLYDKSPDYGGQQGAAIFGCDFFNNNQKDVQKNIDDYNKFIQFECLDDKSGLYEYRKLDIYAPGNKKHQTSGQLQQNLLEIVPTKADLKVCLMQLQGQFDMLLKNGTMTRDDQKAMVADAEKKRPACYDTIKQKTLLICKKDIDKDFSVDNIKSSYPYPYKVVSKEDFDKAIISNDPQYCALLVTPFIKVPGVYGPVTASSIKYIHYIVNLGTQNMLYAGVSGHVMVGTMGMGGYETVTEKNLKQLTTNLQNPNK